MQQISGKMLLFLIIFGVCSAINLDAQTRKSRKSQNNEARLLRNAILKAENITKDNVLTTELNYVSRRVDLNGDGQKEVLVWAPMNDLGGTSGYPIIVFARTAKGYRVLWEDGAWTPLIVLNTKQNGWRDIAYQIGGGGSAWQYDIVRFNGKSYKYLRTQTKQPKGQLIINKSRTSTVFGPVPN